ncbi:hypothetical protein ABXM60_12250, partial [Enterococcus faecium]
VIPPAIFFYYSTLFDSRFKTLQQNRLIYESTKEFLKERTDGLKAFKNVFKGFVDKVKDKTAQFQEKHDLEPKKNEFELTHNREVKKERSRDQGMSL